jgi:predicted dienelactone hydrolase
MNGRRTQSTFLVEELASYGYAVFAIDHPYNSGPIEMADGHVLDVGPNPIEHLGALGPNRVYALINKEVEKQTADTLFVLDTVARWNSDPASSFYRHLDLSRVGAVGHSLGGSVGAEASVLDPRIRAVFDMSGPLFATARDKGVAAKFFYITEPIAISSDEQLSHFDPDARVDRYTDRLDMQTLSADLQRNGGLYAEMGGADHSSFSDKPIFSPLQRLGGAYSQQAARQRFDCIRKYAVAFFSATLRSQPSPLLSQQPSPCPDVTLRSYPGPAFE